MSKIYFKRGKHILTKDEIESAQAELLDLITKEQETEEEKKSKMAILNDKLKGFKEKISKIAGNLNNGYIFKDIECDRVMDYDNKLVIYRSNEDGTTLDTDPMSEADYQMQVPGVSEESTEQKPETDNPFDQEPEITVK